MNRQRVIVQASSTSWSGGRDLCMAIVDGYPVVYWIIKKILDHIANAEVKIAAPSFDDGGELECFSNIFPNERVSLYYGHNESPLNRILDICEDLEDEDYIIRIDGLHFCFDVEACLKMLDLAKTGHFDCVKLPDDFPVQFTSDIYRIGALRELNKILESENNQNIFKVHSKFYMFNNKSIFNCAYLQELPKYSDEYLRQCRKIAMSIYIKPRLEVNENRIWAGDQLTFHYELASKYLQPWMKVLDIACGGGFGARMLAHKVKEIHGADIDAATIAAAKLIKSPSNVQWHLEDITCMNFHSNSFDSIISMETIEHVNEHLCLKEISRILKPSGILILSTPQNRIGHIPVNSAHIKEYSLEEITNLCKQYFIVEKIIGIKAGRIIFSNAPYGTNTVLICQKELN